ncbi:MAG: tetratricopeptide repeat protein [Pirellulaceae bacterium]
MNTDDRDLESDDGDSQNFDPEVVRLAEEFGSRLKNGEDATIDEYVQRYPEFDAQIRHLFTALLAMENIADAIANKPMITQSLDSGSRGSKKPFDQHPVSFNAGSVINDRYTLQQKIGEGGMGEVWTAKQSQPVKRKVAIKLIKTGMDSKAVLNRFEQERQALAMMDHPSIAKILDGGMTATGQPFFVMELVNGLPITRFCDEAKLTLRERLEIFAPVCQAVQHAHHKGIVHRDLKPANILVTMIDGKPVPKVIDFGVSKAVGGKLTENTVETQFGAVVGTMEYMSPEQAGFSGEDVDTRADIYSLGVILYELLTGLRPIDSKRLRKAAFAEMVRMIKEEEPSKPSTRLSTDDSLPSLAVMRHTDPKKLLSNLRGELDWIVLKCLEKSRERRYETANGLAREIQRYLDDEPVEARPPSVTYRIGKLIRRNKVPVIAASLVAAALIAGIIGTTYGLFEAQRQTVIANENAEGERLARIEEEKAKQRAEKNAEGERLARIDEQKATLRAEQRAAQLAKGNEIIAGIFEDLDINRVREGDEPLEAVLATRLIKAGDELEGESIGDPFEVAKLQVILATSLKNLGFVKEAIPLQQKGLATLQKLFGEEDINTIQAMSSLGCLYRDIGDWEKAFPLFEEALSLARAHLGNEHIGTHSLLSNLGGIHSRNGEIEKAKILFKEAIQLGVAAYGEDDPHVLTARGSLAREYVESGEVAKGIALLEQNLEISKRVHGDDHPKTLTCTNVLARAHVESGDSEKQIPILKELLNLQRKQRGKDHPATLKTMSLLAGAYNGNGNFELAIELLSEAYELSLARFGADYRGTLVLTNNLAVLLSNNGQLDKAIQLLEQVAKIYSTKHGPTHDRTLNVMSNLAQAYNDAGNAKKALTILETTANLLTKKHGDGHPGTLVVMNYLAIAYEATGDTEKALQIAKRLLEIRQRDFDENHPQTLRALNTLAVMLVRSGEFELALEHFQDNLRRRKAKFGDRHPETTLGIHNLSWAHRMAGNLDEALPLALEAYALRIEIEGPDHPDRFSSIINLGTIYWLNGDFDEAVKALTESVELSKKALGPRHPRTLVAEQRLACVFRDSGQLQRARQMLEGALEKQKSKPGPSHKETLDTMDELAVTLLAEEKFKEAEAMARECLELRKQERPDHWTYFQTQSILGRIIASDDNPGEGESLLIAAFEGMKRQRSKIPFQSRIRLRKCLESLILVCEKTKDKEGLAKWNKELQSLSERKPN